MIQKHDSVIVQRISLLLIPFIQLFALYVLFHGHYSPGGGFQAGVLIGASIILKVLVASNYRGMNSFLRVELLIACFGLGIYAVIGTIPLFYNAEFFDYGAIQFLAAHEDKRRYWSILIAETGVMTVVAMTLVLIFHILAVSPTKDSDHA